MGFFDDCTFEFIIFNMFGERVNAHVGVDREVLYMG